MADTCAQCPEEPTVRLTLKHGVTELRCDRHDGGFDARPQRVDLPTAYGARRRGPGGRLTVAYETGRVRSSGLYLCPERRGAWLEVMGAAQSLAWLAGVEFAGVDRLPDAMPDPEAAEAVLKLLRGVPIEGARGEAAELVRALAAAACRTLGYGAGEEGSR